MNRTGRDMMVTALLCVLLAACATPGSGDALFTQAEGLRADAADFVVIAVDNDVAAPIARPASTRHAYIGTAAYAAGPGARAALRDLAATHRLEPVAAWPIQVLGMYCEVLRIPDGSARADVLQLLSADARVRLAQPLNQFTTQGVSYNDPYAPLQQGFLRIDAANAQQLSRGERIRVAVIDTGLDAAHADFGGRIRAQRNFVDRDALRFHRDRHGTAVAGVIAAAANNGLGIVGVAPQVQIVALKACWEEPEGIASAARCNSLTLAQALSAAIEARVAVVNLSLTGPKDPLLSALIEAGGQRGTLYVGAAPAGAKADAFPAGVPGVIPVAMAEDADSRREALRAPGTEVVTLMPGGRYDFVTGASVATAHVSGAVALMLAARPGLGRDAVYELLAGSGNPINVCVALATLVKTSASCSPH